MTSSVETVLDSQSAVVVAHSSSHSVLGSTTGEASPLSYENDTKTNKLGSWTRNLGSGIILDVQARWPWYWSDWTDSWNYRVVPAMALIFLTNVLTAIAFSHDLIETTGEYGVAEVLISSVLAAGVFSIFGVQPLTIVGVTAPITVFNKTVYDVLAQQNNPPEYLHFMGWICLWAAIFHWITAILNWCNFLRYVTWFPCDMFSFYVAWVYFQYGIQVLTRLMKQSDPNPTEPGAFVSIILAILMFVVACLFQLLSRTSLFHRQVRRFLADYGTHIALLAASGLAYWGRFNASNPATLPRGGAFQAQNDRPWLVPFWELEAKWVGIALPFGLILWILFFLDHNVSSLMAQGAEFPLRKPPGFHYDFFLLGITTFISGLIGVPAPNGLLPQAPIHTRSLTITGRPSKRDEEDDLRLDEKISTSGQPKEEEVVISVVEQRASNLLQGMLCLVMLTGPFLFLLSLIPQGCLAGFFWFMGIDSLQRNGITDKFLFLMRDKTLTAPDEPLKRVRKSRIIMFMGMQLIGFGVTMALTQIAIASVLFPVSIAALIPIRMFIIPRMSFTEEELSILDSPTASPFTMASIVRKYS